MTGWALATALAVGFSAPPAVAQAPAPFGKVPKSKVRTFVSPIGSFKIEYPASGNWAVLPGPPGSVVALGEYKKGEALVVVERVTLTEALASDEMAQVADREARIVKEREPGAAGLSQRVLDADTRKVIVLEYTRSGIQGPERVVQYVIPQGAALYRVVCMVVASQEAKYAPLFGHIAASIEPAPPKPAK